MIESYKATLFWVDYDDEHHTLFKIKYIDIYLQISKSTF
jgi:hypothetical protein